MSAGAADRFKAGQYRHWGMDHLGTKANLPDLLACFLPEQIRTIDERLGVRESLADKYENELKSSKIKFPKINTKVVHSRHLFPIYVGKSARDESLMALGNSNIGVTVNYRSVTSMNFYKSKYGFSGTEFPNSLKWGEGTLSIPLFPGMTEVEQEYVIEVLLNNVQPLIG
jgi:UDP-4-amino-4-deoxy-L-arabinose-oxoglutarate aminotransferase